jgi:hypothetical protein
LVSAWLRTGYVDYRSRPTSLRLHLQSCEAPPRSGADDCPITAG